MKFIVYCSDSYYPGAEEFDTLEKAKSRFEELKDYRSEEVLSSDCPFFKKDYLAIVVDEIDIDKLQSLKCIDNNGNAYFKYNV